MNFAAILRSLITLTKPTIVLTFTLTGAAAMAVEGSLLQTPWKFFAVLMGILLTAASANGFNQYLERDLDARMARTAKRRPLPQKKIAPRTALIFSVVLGVIAIAEFFYFANFLSGAIALGTILFYAFFYTLWLKPRTPYNIVIGGAAGAAAPLIGWAAATGDLIGGGAWLAWWMFAVIFFWTPPHFWALALNVKDQYAKAGIPMLPVVKGEERTRKEIWWYSVLLALLLYLPLFFGHFGMVYAVSASVLNLFWLALAWKVFTQYKAKVAYQFFGFSIVYLILLFVLMMIA